MKKIFSILFALVLVLTVSLLMVLPVMAAQNVVLDRVDIGSETSDELAGMSGWGPVEPTEHGGNWGALSSGGYPDYSSADDLARVVWYHPDVGTDDPYATVTLDRGDTRGAAKAIRVRHLDGIADDSFDIYVIDNHDNEQLIGSWAGSPGTENWQVHEFTIPNDIDIGRGVPIVVKLVATGPSWSGFDTYGQVAFDWIELVGCGRP